MNEETLRMQMLSGIITESEYKKKLAEFDMDQFSFGNSSSPKASFEDKWNDVPNANKEILKKSTGKEPVKIMASSKGTNYVIAKGSDGKFYRYQYTQSENPGKPMGPFNSEDEAKKLNESLNENFVGMGMVGNIFDREKTDYETAFEHFSKGISLNEEGNNPLEGGEEYMIKSHIELLTKFIDDAEKESSDLSKLLKPDGIARMREAIAILKVSRDNSIKQYEEETGKEYNNN